MFDNLIILVSLLPFSVLFIGGIYTLSIGDNKKKFEMTLLFCILSLIINSLLLFIPDFFVSKESIRVTRGDVVFNEFILVIASVFAVSSKLNLKASKNIEYFPLVYCMIIASFIGMNLTDNLLIIIFFFIMSVIFIAQLFYFGDYEKDFFQLKKFLGIAVFSFSCLVIGAIVIFFSQGTFNLSGLSSLRENDLDATSIFVIILFILGFGAIAGMAPFGVAHLNDYFEESNPLSLKVFSVIFVPVLGISIFRLISGFTDSNQTIGIILFLLGGPGLTVNFIWIIMESFGKFKRQSYSLKKIIGYLACADFNMILILIAARIYSQDELKLVTYTSAILFALASSIAKAMILESLNPIFDDPANEILDLKLLGDYFKIYPRMFYFFSIGVFLMLFPLFPGNIFLSTSLEYLFSSDAISPINQAMLTLSFIFVISYLIVFGIAISIIGSEIFFGKPKYRELSGYQRLDKAYYTSPYLLILIFIVIIVFRYLLGDVYHTLLIDMSSTGWITI
jgi:formate hydrogenlyase subunit 3/multisubunit Na+/H+ antiporter MnhD subunit